MGFIPRHFLAKGDKNTPPPPPTLSILKKKLWRRIIRFILCGFSACNIFLISCIISCFFTLDQYHMHSYRFILLISITLTGFAERQRKCMPLDPPRTESCDTSLICGKACPQNAFFWFHRPGIIP